MNDIEIFLYFSLSILFSIILFYTIIIIINNDKKKIKYYNYNIRYREELEKYNSIINKQRIIILKKYIKLVILKLIFRIKEEKKCI